MAVTGLVGTAPSANPATRWQYRSLQHPYSSCRARITAAQCPKTLHAGGKVLHADLGLGPHRTDGSHDGAAHVIGLRTEYVLDPDPHGRFGPVALLDLLGQRLASFALVVNVEGEPSGFQPGLDLRRPIGCVGPDTGAGIAPRQQVIHHPAVVHRGVGEMAIAAKPVLRF